MDKLKKSHLALIFLVVLLTIYNVLPTVIYYCKPLSKPIGKTQAELIAKTSLERIDQLQKEQIKWLRAYCKHLSLPVKSIESQKASPQLIELCFFRPEHAKKFKALMPRAGSMITFSPAQLSLASEHNDNPSKVLVEGKVSLSAAPNNLEQLFTFVPKYEDQKLSGAYQKLVQERSTQIAALLAGESVNYQLLESLRADQADSRALDTALEINSYAKTFGEKSDVTKRFFMSFSQSFASKEASVKPLITCLEKLSQELSKKIKALDDHDEEKTKLTNDQKQIARALKTIERNQPVFERGESPLSIENAQEKFSLENPILTLGTKHPLIHSVEINWADNQICLHLHSDLENILSSLINTDAMRIQKEKLNQLIINEVARISHLTGESFKPEDSSYVAQIDKQEDPQSYLVMNLAHIAQVQVQQLKQKISAWSPKSPEFANDSFPLRDYKTYSELPAAAKKFGMVTYAPVLDSDLPKKGFQNGSMYVIAKGLNPMLQKYQQFANLEQAENFKEEFIELRNMLHQMGFQLSYLATEGEFDPEFHNDFIFEKPNYYADILAATRENFSTYGSKKQAILEFTDLEHRILTQNKIEGQTHEELLRWKEDYQASLVDLHDPQSRFLIPPPTRNVFFSNFLLSFKEYFRGDNRKILKWGLDLMGGKSILIGLNDQNNRPITDKIALAEGANELTGRVNKMGLSEVDIRVQGNFIALDFPAAKGLSAQELIKGSTMSFHIVNEKFASKNSPYYPAMQKFLQEVWNEALITHHKDAQSIHKIAFKQLGGSEDSDDFNPRSEHAKELIKHGFYLHKPSTFSKSSDFDLTASSIGIYRGDDYTEWRGQSHPLIPLFHNYALEGADIENVKTSYDPSHGNTLTFSVKNSAKDHSLKSPRDIIYSWTSPFAQDKILGSEYEKYTLARGWRMGIVLNGQVINDPQLNQALRTDIQVSGGFTQLEASRLAADLKAGSLSFTPQILSVNNVSADLGYAERTQGITATVIALVLVVAVMVAYYRFSGIIASIAVLFNLLIMWGTLQNLQATLTLSGIAGIILTVGMAVDANVLVFERIREELKKDQKLAVAIKTGYQKAFSAIFDSNITTIIAAIILLNFDAGPIKGLAITLTIGIASSMFTALFMTRSFFTHWLSKTQAKTLHMANWFKIKAFDFLKRARLISVISAFIIVVGATLLVQQHKSILGMDFTGGYSVNLHIDPTSASHYRQEVKEALLSAGAKNTDFQIRELNQPSALRIQLSSALDERGRPFFGMPLVHEAIAGSSWQQNPRLSWIVEALAAKQIKLTASSFETLDKNWSEMSGQLSKTTRNNALMGLALALAFILIYISFRYEIKYAFSAIICIIHDVILTLALIAILHFLGVSVQINMQIIAALMTIIGYSLNDTIIVFDRIREDKKIYRKMRFDDVINHSIGVTLNRTIMTSLTTFVVLLSLVLLGGSKIFDFSLIMSLGVILGTLSSIFIAPLMLQWLHEREKKISRIKSRSSSSSIA